MPCLLLIMVLRLTCGEKNIWQTIKKSQNIMTVIVVPFPKSFLLLLVLILMLIFLQTFIFEIGHFIFRTLMYRFWIMFRWFSFNLLGFSYLIAWLSGRFMFSVFLKFFFKDYFDYHVSIKLQIIFYVLYKTIIIFNQLYIKLCWRKCRQSTV